MTISHEENALNVYIKFLEDKAVDPTVIAQRKTFLNKLLPQLKDKAPRRDIYSVALAQVVKKTRNDSWHQQMNIAREFFPFWMQDVKAIIALSNSFGFDYASIKWSPLQTSLEKLIAEIELERFTEQESILLERYWRTLKLLQLDKAEVLFKLKLAKIMLLRLRDAPMVNNVVYRIVVDMTLPLFNLAEMKQFFLTTVREFFYIWIDKSQSSAAP